MLRYVCVECVSRTVATRSGQGARLGGKGIGKDNTGGNGEQNGKGELHRLRRFEMLFLSDVLCSRIAADTHPYPTVEAIHASIGCLASIFALRRPSFSVSFSSHATLITWRQGGRR